MKRSMILYIVGMLLIGTHLYAANGDLIVGGKVGIGTFTPTPGYKLDVSGDIRSSGTISANNVIGNVTGNVTGSSGSCTGNAASATSADNATNCDKLDNGHWVLTLDSSISLGPGAYVNYGIVSIDHMHKFYRFSAFATNMQLYYDNNASLTNCAAAFLTIAPHPPHYASDTITLINHHTSLTTTIYYKVYYWKDW